jgi:hypothetical protein
VKFYFRSNRIMGRCRLTVMSDGKEIYKKACPFLRPPEMETLALDLSRAGADIRFTLEEVEQ